jgi:ABC-2 type transport system permease protein
MTSADMTSADVTSPDMTADSGAPISLTALPSPARATRWRAFAGLVRRDLVVMTRQWPTVIVGIVFQPLLLVFVFTYVLPKAGFAIGGASRATVYSTMLVAGVVGLSAFTQGFMGVTVNFAVEFGYTREIEDRVLAPLPIWGLGLDKLLIGAFQAGLAGLMVFPIAALVPATPVHLDPHWAALVPAGLLTALLAAAFGLAAGTLIDPGRIQLAATALILPVTFFGAVYYPWESLTRVPVLKYADLANPLVYMNESLRATLTSGIPHMPLWVSLTAMTGFTLVLAVVGINGLYRRALS